MLEKVVPMIRKFRLFLHGGLRRINAIYGGAGSGKSRAVAQEIALRLVSERDIIILVTRKTRPALRITAFKMVKDELDNLIPGKYYVNKSDLDITFNGNIIYFRGLDDPEKIKSAEFNYIWAEEATELTREDVAMLNLRLRRPNVNGNNFLIVTFNPIDAYHHLIEDIVERTAKTAYAEDKVAVHHSTYKDNKFLDPEYVVELENLINRDENLYQIYALGKPGILKNLIYSRYDVLPIPDIAYANGEIFYGLDFGFTNQSGLVMCILYEGDVYCRELIYETGLTNTALIGKMKDLEIPHDAPIYADAAEPQRIEEIFLNDFNISPADKSVKDGLDHVKRYILHISPDSINLLKEIRGYKYREDKDGRVREDPVKFMDHLMDALRYAIHTHLATVKDETYIITYEEDYEISPY
jgi:phage terminase large subunit